MNYTPTCVVSRKRGRGSRSTFRSLCPPNLHCSTSKRDTTKHVDRSRFKSRDPSLSYCAMALSDALLDFLEVYLPPAIYDTIFTLLDYLLMVFTSLNSGFAYFLRSAGCVTRHRLVPRTNFRHILILSSTVGTNPTVRMDTTTQFKPCYRRSCR